MLTRSLIALMTPALLLLGLAWLTAPGLAAPPEKIEICHIPPLNPDNVQTILVTPKAAAKHIVEHGDYEVGGECFEGVGECEMVGTVICVPPGEDRCTADPGDPEEEICDDGLDNDCDGVADSADDDCHPCPCAALWSNDIGAPPLNQANLSDAQCVENSGNDYLAGGSQQTANYNMEMVIINNNEYVGDRCVDTNFVRPFSDTGPIRVDPFTPQEIEACKQLLIDRGCVF